MEPSQGNARFQIFLQDKAILKESLQSSELNWVRFMLTEDDE